MKKIIMLLVLVCLFVPVSTFAKNPETPQEFYRCFKELSLVAQSKPFFEFEGSLYFWHSGQVYQFNETGLYQIPLAPSIKSQPSFSKSNNIRSLIEAAPEGEDKSSGIIEYWEETDKKAYMMRKLYSKREQDKFWALHAAWDVLLMGNNSPLSNKKPKDWHEAAIEVLEECNKIEKYQPYVGYIAYCYYKKPTYKTLKDSVAKLKRDLTLDIKASNSVSLTAAVIEKTRIAVSSVSTEYTPIAAFFEKTLLRELNNLPVAFKKTVTRNLNSALITRVASANSFFRVLKNINVYPTVTKRVISSMQDIFHNLTGQSYQEALQQVMKKNAK